MQAGDVEIMAPVGSYESLMAAIQGGADSVYFGIGHLNMRSKSSKNFTIDDLQKIVEITKQHGVRTYITINTVIYDSELEDMKELVRAAKKYGVTAIIAADMSVINYAKSQGVEIHISTQCNVTNIEAIKFYSQFADVVVTARELNLNQVAAITETIRKENITGPSGKQIQIEMFAHGALCMAVSGKCYLSLDNMNSSANRGACLQPCRRKYDVKDKDSEIELEVDNEYIMSPKDLKTVHFLNKILDAGVKVLKIEGRGRSPEYVKKVTQTYKKAVEAYFENDYTKEKIEEFNTDLNSVYNRGYWNGYYLGQRLGEWTEKYGSQATQKKIFVGNVTNFFSKLNVVELKTETVNNLSVGDKIYIMGSTTGVYEDVVKEIRVDLIPVEQTKKGDLCSFRVNQTIRRGDKVFKIIKANKKEIDFQS
ncbi:MAG: peptidase U32 family protein [Bacteroidota bacterium]|nr:peptidase U32 family protein [Bacteroidota bacterium]